MDCYSQRALLFPRVDEALLNRQKAERACEITNHITAELKRNNTASLYHARLPIHSSPRRLPERPCPCSKPNLPRKKSNSENRARSPQRSTPTTSFDAHLGSAHRIRHSKPVLEARKEGQQDSGIWKSLRVRTEGSAQSALQLCLSPINLKPTIKIKSILSPSQNALDEKGVQPRERTKRYYHRVQRARKPADSKRAAQLQLKFTLLHGWKTEEDDSRL